MKRLTNKREADLQRRNYVKRLRQGYPRNIPEERFLRLAAYEDTGLEPEKIHALQVHPDHAYADYVKQLFPIMERLEELAEAEQQGRLVVLPCKVGDTAWVKDRAGVAREMRLEAPDIRFACTDEDNLCMATCHRRPDGFCVYRLRNDGTDIGKTVFLTREEAERALEGGNGDAG